MAKHLQSGKQCTKLALELNEHASFVLGEDLVARKFKILEGALESFMDNDRESLAAELDARFALLTGEVGILFDFLASLFKVTAPDDRTSLELSSVTTNRQAWDNLKGMAKADGCAVTVSVGGREVLSSKIDERDPLYLDALKHVRDTRTCSISGVQRVLAIGYNRAARLVEALEADGHVSAMDNSGRRTAEAP